MLVANWNTSVVDYTFTGPDHWQLMFNSFRFQMDLRDLTLYTPGFMA